MAADPSSGKVDLVECQSPQQLVATILSRQPQHAMTMDKLSAVSLRFFIFCLVRSCASVIAGSLIFQVPREKQTKKSKNVVVVEGVGGGD